MSFRLISALLLACCALAPRVWADEATTWAIALHGGAGGLPRDAEPARVAAYRAALERALQLGKNLLVEGKSSLDVVEAVVRDLEDDPLFNAGRGAVYTHEGTQELDAAIMDGRDLRCGAVAGLRSFANPVRVARQVMEQSRHVFMAGEGAAAFARSVGLPEVPPSYFENEDRRRELEKALEKDEFGAAPATSDGEKYGTVGCVALDRAGNLAAATSTGGITNKRFGRIGDVPVVGAGTYADNRSCAISCSGKGERFIMNTVARSVSAYMQIGGLSLEAAASKLIDETLVAGDGGLIAVDRAGNIVLDYNTASMFRAAADAKGRHEVRIWEE
jgi:beta-aspartyl-peptidase (threonine type)